VTAGEPARRTNNALRIIVVAAFLCAPDEAALRSPKPDAGAALEPDE
jgi:hypothetical protein